MNVVPRSTRNTNSGTENELLSSTLIYNSELILITSSTDKHYSLDFKDDFRSCCRNISHQQQFFPELHSPGRSHNTNYWYSWVQTIYYGKYYVAHAITKWFPFMENVRVHVL